MKNPKPWPTAWLDNMKSRSPQKLSRGQGFQAKPGQNSTREWHVNAVGGRGGCAGSGDINVASRGRNMRQGKLLVKKVSKKKNDLTHKHAGARGHRHGAQDPGASMQHAVARGIEAAALRDKLLVKKRKKI
jgi:hypothetical protein